jgi:hypothetical protein
MEETAVLVKNWMVTNELKMNDGKTEVMLITPKHMAGKIECPTLVIGDCEVQPTTHVGNLGVTMDSHATMEKHINKVCKSSYLHLYNINRIKPYLDKSSLESVIHAFVTSKLDYGNALLCGYPSTLIMKLQRVQNTAARLLSSHSKYTHITPTLKNLHWLPVCQRIKFKVASLVFKAKHHLAPVYLQDLIKPYTPSRCLRSTSQDLLAVPYSKSTNTTERAFSIAGPRLWNSLPPELRSVDNYPAFKKCLKTYLFVQYFD